MSTWTYNPFQYIFPHLKSVMDDQEVPKRHTL
jgi:hypothetical protein